MPESESAQRGTEPTPSAHGWLGSLILEGALYQNDRRSPPVATGTIVNLARYGQLGHLAGLVISPLAGAVFGGMGAFFPWLLFRYVSAGITGQDEPGVIAPLLEGGWFFALFGLVPGFIVGLATGIMHKGILPSIAITLGVALGYATLFVYGYPSSIGAACFYCLGPLVAPFAAFVLTSRLKVDLGLVPEDEAWFVSNRIVPIFGKPTVLPSEYAFPSSSPVVLKATIEALKPLVSDAFNRLRAGDDFDAIVADIAHSSGASNDTVRNLLLAIALANTKR